MAAGPVDDLPWVQVIAAVARPKICAGLQSVAVYVLGRSASRVCCPAVRLDVLGNDVTGVEDWVCTREVGGAVVLVGPAVGVLPCWTMATTMSAMSSAPAMPPMIIGRRDRPVRWLVGPVGGMCAALGGGCQAAGTAGGGDHAGPT